MSLPEKLIYYSTPMSKSNWFEELLESNKPKESNMKIESWETIEPHIPKMDMSIWVEQVEGTGIPEFFILVRTAGSGSWKAWNLKTGTLNCAANTSAKAAVKGLTYYEGTLEVSNDAN